MKKYSLRRIGVASNDAAVRPSLSDCIEVMLGQGGALAEDVLATLKSQFAKPPPKFGPDGVNPLVRQTVLELLAQSDAVCATLQAELRRLVYQGGSQDPAQPPALRPQDVHVFDIREIEVHIELALSRQEVMRSVDAVLPRFDALVSALLGWSTVQPVLNPLKPEAFVRALHQTLNAWVPDEAVRMVLLRPAAVTMGIGLRQLYTEALGWLRSQGVDPLDQRGSGGRDAAERSRRAETEVQRTMVTLDKLRRLMTGEDPSPDDSAGMKDFTHTIPGSLVALQDLQLVEPMMKRLAQRAARPHAGGAAPTGRAAAPALLTQAQNQQLGRDLGEEVARMMLDQLAHDERLLGSVRAQLRTLEPVLLRLASSDARFFIDRQHPARQFLDRVVQRSLSYGRDDEDGVAGVTACLGKAVDTLRQGTGEAETWALVLDELEQDWSAFEAMRQRQREALQDAREHAEQRIVLAQRFSDALMERFKGAGLPERVASFLRGPWSQVLAEVNLRNTETAPDPRGYLALVDDLVWSVQLPLIRRDYARLIRLIPHLLARLNEGLVLIRYPQEPISIFLDELSALHEKVLGDHRRAVAARDEAPVQSDEAAASDGASSLATPLRGRHGLDAPERRARARAARKSTEPVTAARDLDAGDWVDLLLEGAWVRAELTWISHNRGLFMFVSGAGLSHAMSRRSMDRLESQGRIRLGWVQPPVDVQFDTAHGILMAEEPADGQARLDDVPQR